MINEIFDSFVAVVTEGRSLDESKVREIAIGEMMTAQKGVGKELMDEISDFKDALEAAAGRGFWKNDGRGTSLAAISVQ